MSFHCTSYRTFVDEESTRHGDYCQEPEDRGIVWSSDPEMSDEDNASQFVYDVLKREGACHPSASHFYPGMWYSTEGELRWHTGVTETESYHLVGASEEVQRMICMEASKRGHLSVKVQS